LKSAMLLLTEVINEIGDQCRVSTSRDIKTITARVKHEGLSFLTITLPDFCKGFERSLAEGQVAPNLFKSFSFTKGLPSFLSGFLELVFNPSDGRLLNDPSIEAILAVRQITLLFSKVNLDCTEERVAKAIRSYVECERELTDDPLSHGSDLVNQFRRVGLMLWSEAFSEMEKYLHQDMLRPKHGSGSTADGIRGNAKYNQWYWPMRLEEVFSSREYLFPSWSYYDESLVNFAEPGNEIPVKVITVPKTLKTPRIIAEEPTSMMFMQQGLHEMIQSIFRVDKTARWLVNYDSQVPNQDLARRGSIDGSLATLDLSEASDRVSNVLVEALISGFPELNAAVFACRSTSARVPGYGVIPLTKFASMGSALCFPFEALVFSTIVFCGIEDALNRRLTLRDINRLRGKVRVYGDDIIVPTDMAPSVASKLSAFKMKVNANKSFWTGMFRESCGKEYYAGHDVSIVKLRRMPPTQRKHVQELVSLVAFRNLIYKAGLWRTSRVVDSWIERLIPFPSVADTSPVLGKYSFTGYQSDGWDLKLQRPLVKGVVPSPRLPKDPLDGYGALAKFLLKRGDQPIADVRHLERAGRPRTVDIPTRWAPPF
jgi:hypothetical protein